MATNTLEEDMSKTDQDEATDLEGGLPDERPADPQCEGGDESVGQGIGASAQEASEDQTNQHEEPKESTLDEREKQASGETGGGEGQGDAQAQDMDGAPDPNVQLAAKDSNINERPRNVPLDEERQLSDTLDRWTRRLQALEATNDENEVSQPKDGQSHEQTSEIKDVQYVHENQASEHQALGAADAHQQISASDLGNVEADMADPMNIDDEDATLEQQMPPEPAALELGSTSNEVSDRGGTESRALTSSEIRGDLQTAQQPNVDSVPVDSLNIGDAEDDGHREDPQALQSLNAALLQWQTSDKQHMSTSQAWKMYCNLTRSASFHLTEQLRLILEPTQATRLQGDYRTGKRLNMKRLIPYIASEFTKDKIWLRRTRPSDRSYQVLIALDDSKSMADPDMVHLTFQTLALVTSALERLEVGQVAVESFGSQTRVLHDFQDGNIGISNGQKLLDGVTFTQSKTDYMQLLRTALQRFADARSLAPPSTNGELWQLMFIISDGSMDNFESVRSCLRQATQNKVFIVFVIVDSASRNQSGAVANTSTENQSILERRFARVGTNSSGQLDIQEARYMDLFPFDYYVVLKEAASLPDVLCRTLRQFFEMVSFLSALFLRSSTYSAAGPGTLMSSQSGHAHNHKSK